MEYDPAFPTEDNDDEIEHVLDVTAIPLPITTKRKSKRQSKLMKIPLPEDKSELISKPLVSSIIESSNSPQHEPDSSWLLPTSTQGPLKFNILKPNSIKPTTDEDSSIFDDIESKLVDSTAVTKSIQKLLPPKKPKPVTLPTGVITKNADFVVSEPKTNTELFLPPKIVVTSIEGMPTNFIDNSSSNPNMIAAVSNNQNNQYQLLNMSYIIPQKLRSAQMICQPLVANPAVAALSQKKAVQETISKGKNSSKSRSKSPKLSKMKSETVSIDEEYQQKPHVKKARSASSNSDKGKRSRESRSNSKDFKNHRKKSSKFHSRSRSCSETRNKWSNNTGNNNNKNKTHRSNSRQRSRSNNNKQYQELSKRMERSNSKSRSRINRKSPNQSRHKSSADSRNRRSHSPHRILLSSSRNRQSPTQSSNDRHKNRRSTSKSKKQLNKLSKRKRSHSKKLSISPENHSRRRRQISTNEKNSQQKRYQAGKSNSPVNEWLCDSNDDGIGSEIIKKEKPPKDCWAVESEPESEPKLYVSDICDKIKSPKEVQELSCTLEYVKTQSKIEETNIIDEKIIVSSSNTVFSDLKIDKNEDAIVSSTVDESGIDYLNYENDPESMKHDTDSQKSQPLTPRDELRSSNKSPTHDIKTSQTLLSHTDKDLYSNEKSTNNKLKCDPTKEKCSRVESKPKKLINRKSPKCRERSNCRSPAKRSRLKSRSRSRSAEPKSKKLKEDSYNRNHLSRAKNYDSRVDYENDGSSHNSPVEKYSSGKSKKKAVKRSSSPVTKVVRRDRWEKEYKDTKKRNRSTSSRYKSVEKVKTKKHHRYSDSSVDSCDWQDDRKSRKNQSRNWKRVNDRSLESSSPSHRDQRKKHNSLKYSGRRKNRSGSYDSRNDYDMKIKMKKSEKTIKHIQLKRKRHSHNSNSDSKSGSNSSTEETSRKDSWRKTREIEKYQQKRRIASQKQKDSDSSSMNSGKIPASYQDVKKRKEKFSISDSEKSFESIKRRQKSRKTRRI